DGVNCQAVRHDMPAGSHVFRTGSAPDAAIETDGHSPDKRERCFPGLVRRGSPPGQDWCSGATERMKTEAVRPIGVVSNAHCIIPDVTAPSTPRLGHIPILCHRCTFDCSRRRYKLPTCQYETIASSQHDTRSLSVPVCNACDKARHKKIISINKNLPRTPAPLNPRCPINTEVPWPVHANTWAHTPLIILAIRSTLTCHHQSHQSKMSS
ncbi:hypothetical protein BaRGS_00010283, partial [Batillaria attramentaria]